MIGEALRLIRVFHDYKINDLSSALGLSASYISEIENGRKNPSLESLRKYADHFETSLSAIMFFSEDLEKEETATVKSAVRHKLVRFLQIIEHETA